MIGHFDDVSRQIEEECIMARQRRWNNLPHSLKKREYHTPEILRGALERAPLFKRAMQEKIDLMVGTKAQPTFAAGAD